MPKQFGWCCHLPCGPDLRCPKCGNGHGPFYLADHAHLEPSLHQLRLELEAALQRAPSFVAHTIKPLLERQLQILGHLVDLVEKKGRQ